MYVPLHDGTVHAAHGTRSSSSFSPTKRAPARGPLTPHELNGPEAEYGGNSGEAEEINATTCHGF